MSTKHEYKVHLLHVGHKGQKEALCGAHNNPQNLVEVQLSPYTKLVTCKRCLQKNEKRLKFNADK